MTAVWLGPSLCLLGTVYLWEMADFPKKNFLENGYLLLLGNISFEIFLIHQLIIRYLSKIFDMTCIPMMFVYPVALALTVGAAWWIQRKKA